jgi:hypothetical protein
MSKKLQGRRRKQAAAGKEREKEKRILLAFSLSLSPFFLSSPLVLASELSQWRVASLSSCLSSVSSRQGSRPQHLLLRTRVQLQPHARCVSSSFN